MKPFKKRSRHLFALSLTLLLSGALFSQPDYNFSGGVLQSGTALTVGAVYRFSNVKTNLDALVTFTFISPGCNLTKIDNDGGQGYTSAFQPEINVPSNISGSGNSNGYAQFHIVFVTHLTSSPVVQTKIDATAIDIDGFPAFGGNLNEYDEISMGPLSYVDFDMLGSQLSISQPAGWMRAVNSGSVDYGGINIGATAVMATCTNWSVSAIDYRTGVINHSTGSVQPRQKSLYFSDFTYPNSSHAFLTLPKSDIISFKGTVQGKVQLNWQLNNPQYNQKISLEKSYDGKSFTELQNFYVARESTVTTESFNYSDELQAAQNSYYRLKLTSLIGKTEYSNVLVFTNKAGGKKSNFDVFPSIIKSAATISVTSEKSGTTQFTVVNRYGQVVVSKQLPTNEGKNVFNFNIAGNLSDGFYVATVNDNGKVSSQKIIIQK